MAQTRKRYRSRTNRKLGGVCGGLAQYFNTDATLIRVLFVVLALLGGLAW
jgi:phage shock protein C